MKRRNDSIQNPISPPEPAASAARINTLRRCLADREYMNEAVQRLAAELSIELMETTYGISFR
jgi:hypothetical protein